MIDIKRRKNGSVTRRKSKKFGMKKFTSQGRRGGSGFNRSSKFRTQDMGGGPFSLACGKHEIRMTNKKRAGIKGGRKKKGRDAQKGGVLKESSGSDANGHLGGSRAGGGEKFRLS